METKTKYHAMHEAMEKVEPIKKKQEEKCESIIKHSALIITLLTVFSIIVLYAYNTGVAGVYNIPNNYISVNLQSYIPIIMKICGIYYVCVLYCVQWKTDIIFNKKKFNFLKLLYAELIFSTITLWLGFEGKVSCIISILIPIVFESILHFATKKQKNSKNEEITDEQLYKQKVESYVHDSLSFLFLNKKGLCFLIIAIMSAPLFGTMYANNKSDFEIINIEEENYAIIVDYLDSAIVQKVQINKNKLIIDTNSYQLISKEKMNIEYKEFENVTIKGAK